jgi:hypothetical protein
MEVFPMVRDVPQREADNRPPAPEVSLAEVARERLRQFAEIFEGLEDYVVFSSTAMFLHGQRLGDRLQGEEWAVPPGDFDANFFTEAAWLEAARRLERAGAVFAVRGERAFPGQDIRVHRGTLDGYEFELFLRSDRIIPPVVNERAQQLYGLRVISLEDVQRQYERNLEFDTRLWREVQANASALEAARHQPESFQVLCDRFSLTEREGHEAVALWERYRVVDDQQKQEIEKKLSGLLGGLKTKTAQRLRNLSQIR